MTKIITLAFIHTKPLNQYLELTTNIAIVIVQGRKILRYTWLRNPYNWNNFINLIYAEYTELEIVIAKNKNKK